MAFTDLIWHKWLKRPYRLTVQSEGQGRTTLVLLHGVAASRLTWRPLLKLIDPEKYRVIVPDLLGFGESPKPQWPNYTVNDHAKAVLAVIKREKIQGKVVIMGHSMGCLIAAHIAATQPKKVRRLVLYEPPLLGELPDFPGHSKRSARYKSFFEYIAAHPQLAHVEARMLWRIARKMWGTHLSEDEWLPFERSLRNTILAQQAYDELRDIPIKTDIIYGRLDLVVIRRGIEKLFAHNKKVALHLVTDFHGLSQRSAKYLYALLQDLQQTGKLRR
jgi:pimeloyl-ACP methyl ester carboxylesterase